MLSRKHTKKEPPLLSSKTHSKQVHLLHFPHFRFRSTPLLPRQGTCWGFGLRWSNRHGVELFKNRIFYVNSAALDGCLGLVWLEILRTVAVLGLSWGCWNVEMQGDMWYQVPIVFSPA